VNQAGPPRNTRWRVGQLGMAGASGAIRDGALKCCPNGVEALLRSGAAPVPAPNVDGTFFG